MNKKEKKKLIKAEEKEINKILKGWDPIPSSPKDEYDCLTHHLISKLHGKFSQKGIASFIKKELIEHFGIEEKEDKIKDITAKIFSYWENKPR